MAQFFSNLLRANLAISTRRVVDSAKSNNSVRVVYFGVFKFGIKVVVFDYRAATKNAPKAAAFPDFAGDVSRNVTRESVWMRSRLHK